MEAGVVAHDAENELVCVWQVADKVPYFNAGIYLENKRRIGKVDEILGKISEVYFTVKMDPGVLSKSFQPKDAVYIGTDKLLPLSRFTNPSGSSGGGRGGRGGGGRGRSPGGRGGRGGGRGGMYFFSFPLHAINSSDCGSHLIISCLVVSYCFRSRRLFTRWSRRRERLFTGASVSPRIFLIEFVRRSSLIDLCSSLALYSFLHRMSTGWTRWWLFARRRTRRWGQKLSRRRARAILN